MLNWLLLGGAFIFIVYQYLVSRNSVFKRLGINGPPPKLLFGNLLDTFTRPIGLTLQKWTKSYGKTYGFYEGGRPVLVTSDLDILKDVFISQFSSFHGRRPFPLAKDAEKDKNVNVFMARGIRWKRLRSITNPTFTNAKLKQLYTTIDDCVSIFSDRVQAKAESCNSFDIYPFLQELTLDVIARVAFGETSSCQGAAENAYMSDIRGILSPPPHKRYFAFLALIMPEFMAVWRNLASNRLLGKLRGGVPFHQLHASIHNVIKQRKRAGVAAYKGATDFIQLFLEAEADDGFIDQKSGENGLNMGNLKVERRLTSEEIVSQCLLFLIAGFDTSANTLAFTISLLAANPEAQERVFEEMDSVDIDSGAGSYDKLRQLVYTEQVIKESLRLYPHASLANARECMVACRAGQMDIPAGLGVAADTWSLHRDTHIWGDDAEQFRPERFGPEESAGRHPLAWIPFGAGPRICIGMRFALVEMKLALYRLCRDFRIETTPETKVSTPLSMRRRDTLYSCSNRQSWLEWQP